MRLGRYPVGVGAVLVLWPVSLAVTVTTVAVTSAEDAEVPTADEICLGCHEDYDQTLSTTTHRLSSQVTAPAAAIACISCHSGAQEHLDDPRLGTIGNPGGMHAGETEKVCTACHMPHLEVGVVGFDPHFKEDISCTSCHRIHAVSEGLLIDQNGDFCSGCHRSVVPTFMQRSNHPLTDQAVTCLSCHDFSGGNDVSLGHGGNANCYRCHPEQSGPYVFEHEATSSFSTQGDGCDACHRPHGSPNERLLTQPGDGLCRQCHGVPPRHGQTHGGLGSQFECIECHSDVHGSYYHRALLDPQLGVKIGGEPGSCYCHGVGD